MKQNILLKNETVISNFPGRVDFSEIFGGQRLSQLKQLQGSYAPS